MSSLISSYKRYLMTQAFKADALLDIDKAVGLFKAGLVLTVLGLTLFIILYVLIVNYILMIPSTYLVTPIILVLVGILVLSSYIIVLKIKINNKKYELETELPFASMFITIVAALGLPLTTALEYATKLSVLKRFKREIYFLKKISLFYILNLLDAMDIITKFHPSEKLRFFYKSLIVAERSGGNRYKFLMEYTKNLFKLLEDRVNRLIERHSLLTNLIILLFVLVPLGTTIIAAIFAGQQGMNVTYLANIGFPFLAFVILFFVADSMIPKEIVEKPPFKPLIISLSLAIAIIAVYNILSMFMGLNYMLSLYGIQEFQIYGIILALSLIPSAIYYAKWYYDNSTMVNSLPIIARHVAEENKKGKTPKQAVMALLQYEFSKRVNSFLRYIVARLTFGLDIRSSIAGLKLPWMFRAYFEILDSSDKLGSDPKSLDILADAINDIVRVRKILDDRSKSFLFSALVALVILITGFQIVNSTVLTQFVSMGELISGTTREVRLPVNPISEEMRGYIVNISYIGIMINAALMGLVTGKIMKGSIAAGTIIALIFVIIALVILSFLGFVISGFFTI